MKKVCISITAAIALALAARGEAKSAVLMTTGYRGGTVVLQNFQALVRLSEGQYGFSYDDYAAKDGSDIWFTDSSGNVIPHEIDTWNASGYSFIWVRIPEIAGTDTWIKMHWGEERSAETTAASSVNIWKNNNDGKGGYAGVWHMGAASGNATEPDATGNGLDAAVNGAGTDFAWTGGDTSQMTSVAFTTTSAISTSGYTGGCRVNTTNNKLNGLLVPDYKNKMASETVFTISGWFMRTNTSGNYQRLISARTKIPSNTERQGWALSQGDAPNSSDKTRNIYQYGYNYTEGKPCNQRADLGKSLVNNWCYITAVYDGTTYKLYSNGNPLSTVTDSGATFLASQAPSSGYDNVTYGFVIGGIGEAAAPFTGKYDEVRLYDGVESAQRIQANYDTMTSPDTFLTRISETGVATAEWTGGGNDGSISNPLNWLCKNAFNETIENALPASDTVVTIAGDDLDINMSTTETLAYSTLHVAIGSMTLSGNRDLRGLGSNLAFAQNAVIDLNGHTLSISSFGSTAATITDTSAGDPGVLELTVANAADTVSNTAVAINGNLKFLKNGAGVYVPVYTPSLYTGGTDIAAGTVKANANGHPNNALGRWSGKGFTDASNSEKKGFAQNMDYRDCAPVTIREGSVFDFNGKSGWTVYHFAMDGGTLTDGTGLSSDNTSQIGSTKLLSPSTVNVAQKMQFWENHVTDLNGQTLTIRIGSGKQLTYGNSSGNIPHVWTNGTIDVVSGGLLKTVSRIDGKTVTFRQNCNLNIGKEFSISNYVSILNQTTMCSGNGPLKVYGDFRPEARYFYAPQMQDGSTLDFSAWTTSFPVATAQTGTAGRTITFADGTVYLKLGKTRAEMRELAGAGTYILKWETNKATRNANTAFLFASDEESFNGAYELKADETGLKVVARPGFTIRVAEGGPAVTIPSSWIQRHTDGLDYESDPADVSEAMLTTGANGLPKWQSYCLGLNPENADSVILCEAADGQTAEGKVSITVKNLNVPAMDGVTVTAYLDRKVQGGDWTVSGEGQVVSSGYATFTAESAETGVTCFRVRLGIQ